MKVKCITNTILIDGYNRNEPSLQIGKEYTLPNQDENYWIMTNRNWSVWVEEESKWIPAAYFVSLEDWKKEWRDKQLIELGI